MGHHKAIEHGKEKRKEYQGAKAFDRSCRNHGGCSYCAEGRQHKRNGQELDAQKQIDEYKGE